jgi:hypothetical protein
VASLNLPFYIMVVVPPVDGAMDEATFDEQWDFSDEMRRPEGVGPVPVARVNGFHFGVVVRDVVAAMSRYADLLGLDEVVFYEIASPNSTPRARQPMVTLRNATYLDKPVEHRLLSTLTAVADFGVEVLQVTAPPIHYKEDFVDLVVKRDSPFLSDGAPLRLRSGMRSTDELHRRPHGAERRDELRRCERGSASTSTGTRGHLGGYLIEVVLAQPGLWESFAQAESTFTIDYSPRPERRRTRGGTTTDRPDACGRGKAAQFVDPWRESRRRSRPTGTESCTSPTDRSFRRRRVPHRAVPTPTHRARR